MRARRLQLGRMMSQAVGAFEQPGFGPYFGGQVATAAGFNLADIGRAWLVYSLTGSAMALGWLRTGWSVASLTFPLLGGLVADRFEKRTVMVAGGVLVTLPLLLICGLMAAEVLRWWYLPISIMVESTLFCFIVPARQAFVSILVKPETLMNAMSLDSVAMALPALLFSLVGGALVDSVGARSAFLCAAVAYALGAIIFSRLPATGPAEPRQSLSSRVLGQGFRYLVRHRMLLGILGLAAGRNILLAPSLAFLPVFASAFQTGALGLGALAASLAGGRLGGSLLAAVLGDSRHKVRLLLGAGMASGILVVLFAQSRSFGLAVLFLCLSGATQMIYAVVESTILQAVTAREMRGRVAGFLRMTAGLTPVALLPVGYLVDLWGAPQAVSLAGVVAMLLFAVAALACAFRQVRLD